MAFWRLATGYTERSSLIGRDGVASARGKASSPRAALAQLTLRQAAVIAASAVLAKLLYIDLVLGQMQDLLTYLWPALALVAIQHVFFKEMRLNTVNALLAPTMGLGAILGGLTLSYLMLVGILYLAKVADIYSRGWLLCWALISAVGIIVVRRIAMKQATRLAAAGELRHRIALVGTPDFVAAVSRRLEEHCRDSRVIAVFAARSTEAAALDQTLGELQAAIAEHTFDRIVIAAPPAEGEMIRQAVKALSAYTNEVLLCTGLEPPPVPAYGPSSLGGLGAGIVNTVPLSEEGRLLKRAFDLVVASLALVVLSPLLALVAILIKLDSPGNVLFRQRRYGQNNRIFTIYKFRTMTVTEDGSIVQQARRGDPRVTRIGRLLRASSIDELPQLLNVLKGDMSIVGPRPHAIAHDIEFDKSLDEFARRRRVLPGMTGWAQVNGYRGETRTLNDVRARMNYDLYYIENWSIWLDLEIVARTIITVLRGAY